MNSVSENDKHKQLFEELLAARFSRKSDDSGVPEEIDRALAKLSVAKPADNVSFKPVVQPGAWHPADPESQSTYENAAQTAAIASVVDDATALDSPDGGPAWYQRLAVRHYFAGGLCFLAGALFWNLVGVWHVISNVIEPDPAPTERALIERVMKPKTDVQLVTRQVDDRTAARDEAKSCTTLVLDRDTGLVSKTKCQPIIRGRQVTEPVPSREIGETAARNVLR